MLDTRLFPTDYRGKYPHMFPKDIAVWERFLDIYGKDYNGFYYDVVCGKECEPKPEWSEPYARDAAILSRLRIDAIGVKDDSLDIIEVKPRANMASVGQVLTYREHYISEHNPTKYVKTLIVAETLDPNILPLTLKHGISYILV